MQAPLILDYEIYDEDGPCAPYFTGRITDADGRVMCNAENEERAAELIDYVAALRARVARLEEVLKQIADGYIRKPICPRMDGTIECGNHLMNRAMMMGLASATLRGEE